MLQDVVENLFLEHDGSVRHARRPHLPPTEQFSSRLHHLPDGVRRRYLVMQCRSFLYGFYFLQPDLQSDRQMPLASDKSAQPSNGAAATNSDAASGAISAPLADTVSCSALANNLYKGLDTDFYDALVESNCGEGYFDSNWQILPWPSSTAAGLRQKTGTLAVQKHGLTIAVKKEIHLAAEDRHAMAGDRVAVKLPPQRIEAERYIAIGNRGLPNRQQVRLKIFFNLEAQGAAAIVAQATKTLNELNLPFQLEVLNHPELYEQRCDGAILEIHRCDYDLLQMSISSWAETLPLQSGILPMTLPLSIPGVSVAEPILGQLSVVEPWPQSEQHGLQRCEAIAEGLVAAHSQNLTAATERSRCIAAALERRGVHKQLIYLNQCSEAISV